MIVIGGGSGGMACAKQASSLGARVTLFDYVKPSPQGSVWGLGGTCVNVGCVPKKLFHFSSLLGHSLHDAEQMGWNVTVDKAEPHSWDKLVDAVTNHVKMLNFRYRSALKKKDVNYINALASFIDKNTIKYILKDKKGNEEIKTMTAKYIVIAVGGRPHIPADVRGAIEFAVTSDDLFTLDRAPGKTLCVGGAYISLECAGFLTELGYDVTVAVRSILLRGFDRQCAEKVGHIMNNMGTKFIYGAVPTSVERLPSGQLKVTLRHPATSTEVTDVFDTVLFATGRQPDTSALGLDNAGVVYDKTSEPPMGSKIPVVDERTNVENIFAVGDVCEGKLELTPVAVKAGELLARRLFGGSAQLMDYGMVATTVFTPVEYGSVGLSEEEAVEKLGAADVEVFLFEFTPLELSAVHRTKHPMHGDDEDFGHPCLSKLVCAKSQGMRVVGFHFVGPNAGEVTQGFALAVKLGATKQDFDDLVGIHPTDAESFCAMGITRASGASFTADGGCGGGVCG